MPPEIEMRSVTEHKFVERLLFLDFSHLIIDKKYTICFTTCVQNLKNKLFCLF